VSERLERRGAPRIFSLLIGIVGLVAAAYALTDGAIDDLPFGAAGVLAAAALLVGALILAWTVLPRRRKD